MRRLEEWIEYIEDDMDVRGRSKLELLLKYSRENQIVHDNLCRLRQFISEADPAKEIEAVLEDSRYLESFHKRVMKRIKATAERPGRPRRARRGRDRKLSAMTYKR